LQGNLDPTVLFAPKGKVRTERVLQSYGKTTDTSSISGHGILPKRRIENAVFVQLRQGN